MIIEGKEYHVKMHGKTYHCALDITMDYIGGKWKSVILWYLLRGPKRFSELKRQIPDITEKMLSLQLRQMEGDGILQRKIYPQVPPKVEYFLSKEGKTLVPMIEAMAKWGRAMADKYGNVYEVVRVKKKKKVSSS